MTQEKGRRIDVRPNLFPVAFGSHLRDIDRWFSGHATSEEARVLIGSLPQLATHFTKREASTIVDEVRSLALAANSRGDRSAQAQAASQAANGRFNATEATVRVFAERLRPGEAEGFVAIAHLVAAVQNGVGLSGERDRNPAAWDHLDAGMTYLAQAIATRAESQFSAEGADYSVASDQSFESNPVSPHSSDKN